MFAFVDFPPHDLLAAFQVFFALCVGHAIADFPLQGEFLAVSKNRHLLKKLQDPSRPPEIWVTCLSMHCLIHAGFIWAITGSSLLAAIEFVIHFFLDVAKCDGKTNFNQDQAAHILCKAAYAVVIWFGWLA